MNCDQNATFIVHFQSLINTWNVVIDVDKIIFVNQIFPNISYISHYFTCLTYKEIIIKHTHTYFYKICCQKKILFTIKLVFLYVIINIDLTICVLPIFLWECNVTLYVNINKTACFLYIDAVFKTNDVNFNIINIKFQIISSFKPRIE